MKTGRLLAALLVIGILGFAAFWWLTRANPISASELPNRTPDLANGRYIFDAAGCASCHAVPGQQDRYRLGGGLPISTAFGTFHVPNISPDDSDGIGKWTEADFVNAVMRGISPGGEHYFPVFPYVSYQHAAIDDIRDLYAFIRTLPPVTARVRAHEVRFPFNIRRSVGIWKLLFLDNKPFTPDASHSARWNRGAYLVNSLGHCAECHSPRNALGGIIESQRFAGGPDPEGEGWVPNITQKGLAEWSQDDIADFLESGMTPSNDSAGGSMVRVIRNTSQLKPEDRAAMADYLKSLPPIEGPKPVRKLGPAS